MKQNQLKFKRQKSWKRYSYLFNQCKNLNFQCQCGKNYTSFPGLYLHFQRKHGQKISTKFSLNDCQVISEVDKTTYRYKFEVKRFNRGQDNGSEDHKNDQADTLTISSVLQKFVRQSWKQLQFNHLFTAEVDIRSFVSEVVSKFQIFILKKLKEQENNKSLKVFLNEIPYKFNNFIEQSSILSILTFQKTCEVLMSMSVWLRKEGYSDLILQRNTQ